MSHLFPWLTAPWASGCSFSLWLWSLLFLSFAFGLSPDVHPGPTPFNTSDVSHARVVSAASVCVAKKMRNRRLQVLLPIVPNLSQCCSNVTIDISVSVLFSVDVNPDRHTSILNTQMDQWIVSPFRMRLAYKTIAGLPILGFCLGLRPSK